MGLHEVCMSPDKRYRYWLEANVSDDKDRVCMFLMLNPSTANATKSDPTVNTCKRFAKDWGLRDDAGVQPVCAEVSLSPKSQGKHRSCRA